MTSTNRLTLVGCENYRREVQHVLLSEGFADVELLTTSVQCGRPGAHWQLLLDTLPPNKVLSNVRTFGCACLGANEAPPKGLCGLRNPSHVHGCYLVAPKDTVGKLIAEGSYLLTPGWLHDWRRRIGEWGFDEVTAREYFSESAANVVLLDTGIDPTSNEQLIQFAEFVQRPYARVYVGMDMIRLSLWKLVLEWRLECKTETATSLVAKAERQKIDYAMAMDILGELARTQTEPETIENIVELFSTLFAPKDIGYHNARRQKPESSQKCSEPAEYVQNEIQEFIGTDESHRHLESQGGFLIRFSYAHETLGVLRLTDISFPEFSGHYLNLALAIAPVCGLILRNARIHEELLQTNGELRIALADVKTLSGLVPICAHCKKIRDDKGFWNKLESYVQSRTNAKFSHGICPDCLKELYPTFHRS